MTCSCSSVKGYAQSKSSAFSTSGAKYGAQSLMHTHMMSHYRRIDSAKAIVDNKQPECMKKFIKAHSKKVDIQKRKYRKIEYESQLSRSNASFREQYHHYGKNGAINRPYTAFSETYEQRREFVEDTVRPASADATRLRHYERLKPEASLVRLSALQLQDIDINESFKVKRSSTPISYRKANCANVSSYRTPRYKVEMYEQDEGQPEIKGSLYDTTNTVMNVSKWRGKPRQSANDTNNLLKEQLQQSPEYKKLKKQEELIAEEETYLKFVEDVTSDVLARGIFSDRVLHQVFDTHIERRKHELNEDRMRELIDELKTDLNLNDTET